MNVKGLLNVLSQNSALQTQTLNTVASGLTALNNTVSALASAIQTIPGAGSNSTDEALLATVQQIAGAQANLATQLGNVAASQDKLSKQIAADLEVDDETPDAPAPAPAPAPSPSPAPATGGDTGTGTGGDTGTGTTGAAA